MIFSEYIAAASELADDIADYGDPEESEAWWKVGSYFDANLENAFYYADENKDPSFVQTTINEIKEQIKKLYKEFLTSDWYKDYLASKELDKKNVTATGGDWEPEGLLEGEKICEQATLNPNGELIFGKYRIFQAGSGTQTAYYADENKDPSFVETTIDEIKEQIKKLYKEFLTSNWYKDYLAAKELDKKNVTATGGDWDPSGLLEEEEIYEQVTLNPNGGLRFGKYKIFQAGSGTQSAPYAQAINDTNLFSNRLATDVKSLEALGFKFDSQYHPLQSLIVKLQEVHPQVHLRLP